MRSTNMFKQLHWSLALATLLSLGTSHALAGNPPPNDDCANATVLVIGTSCTPVIGEVQDATQSLPAITCNTFMGNANDDVWYSFTASATAHTIDVAGSTSFDAVVELLQDGCSLGPVTLGCADATVGGGIETIAASGLVIGVTYWIRVYDYSSGYPATTTFTIRVTEDPPPPANDACTGAITLTVGTSCTPVTGSVQGATQSLPGTGCNGPFGYAGECDANDDVWFSFVATVPWLRIDVASGSGWSYTVVEVFGGTCGSLFSIQCNRLGFIPRTDFVPGTTYYVRVYECDAGFPCDPGFTICVSEQPIPPNDECPGAIPLPVGPTCIQVAGNGLNATQSLPGIQCGNFGSGEADDDTWFSFEATVPIHRIEVTSSLLITCLEVYSGTCGALTSIGCATGDGGTVLHVQGGLTPGTTYYVRVYEYYGYYPQGVFSLCVLEQPLPPNDACADALVLPVEATCVPTIGSALGASGAQPGNCGGATPDDDVWYRFVATGPNIRIAAAGANASFDAVLELYMAGCGGTFVDCANLTGFGEEEEIVRYDLLPGLEYFVRVYDFYTGWPYTEFNICAHLVLPPNDECADAIPLAVSINCNPVNGNVTGATGTEPGACGAAVADEDVWYTFTATAPILRVQVNGSPGLDAVIELYADPCGSTLVDCANSTAVGGSERILRNDFVPGNNYRLRAYDAGTGAPLTSYFSICVYEQAPPPNDECAFAQPITADPLCTPVTGDVAGATYSDPLDACAPAHDHSDDVWYSFVATSPVLIVEVEPSPGMDPAVQLFSSDQGNCAILFNINCRNDHGIGEGETLLVGGLTTGIYYVRVYDVGPDYPISTEFSICLRNALDCEGVLLGPAQPGTACDDNDPTTQNDVYTTSCDCAGASIFDCTGVLAGPAQPGTPCDDGDPDTSNDSWNSNCGCYGALPVDCHGVPGGPVQPGTPCDDNDPDTGNDLYTTECVCLGGLIDCLGNAGGNALPSTPCNDGNINTINDAWDGSCTCTGTLLTFDCLGVVDGPAVPGTPCDDGVLVTTNDQFDADCACVGMDCAGVLGGDALPGLPCDDGNAWSYNDLWTFDCSCAGIVGVEEHLLGDAIVIYPDPAEVGTVMLRSARGWNDARITVLDISGRVLRTEQRGLQQDIAVPLDLSTLPPGMYTVHLFSEGRSAMQRLSLYR
ncbi:MAG: T9SS type A sorting domain-containing protein [Flavobacteriales bacterium]|nr:T9SS type A sorting domain-containing protein [Flavobacteriales bacterium]